MQNITVDLFRSYDFLRKYIYFIIIDWFSSSYYKFNNFQNYEIKNKPPLCHSYRLSPYNQENLTIQIFDRGKILP